MTVNTFKVAVLGSGSTAEYHLRVLKKSKIIEPTVIFGKHHSRVSYLSNQFDLIPAESLEHCLSLSHISFVDISTSNDLHFLYALAALRANKSVILEKPAAFTFNEVETLVQEADSRNLLILICLQKRYNSSFQQVRKLLSRENFGTFLFGESKILMPRKPEYYDSKRKSTLEFSGGGVLIYQAFHDLDLICLLLGTAQTIKGSIKLNYHTMEVEDTASLILEFESCGMLHFFASTDIRFPSLIETQLIFERGRVAFNDTHFCWHKIREPKLRQPFFSSRSLPARIINRLMRKQRGHYGIIVKEMEDFLMNQDVVSTCSLKTAKEAHRVIETLYKQSRN